MGSDFHHFISLRIAKMRAEGGAESQSLGWPTTVFIFLLARFHHIFGHRIDIMSPDGFGAGMLQGVRHRFRSLDLASLVILQPCGAMLAADGAEG